MSVSASTSYILDHLASDTSSDQDELDSLPDSADSDSIDSDVEESDAEREWTESLEQLELLLTMVIVPYLGKYFGRKCAYWGECCEEEGGMTVCALTSGADAVLEWQAGLSSWSGNTPWKW